MENQSQYGNPGMGGATRPIGRQARVWLENRQNIADFKPKAAFSGLWNISAETLLFLNAAVGPGRAFKVSVQRDSSQIEEGM